jgi:hypothetical protein
MTGVRFSYRFLVLGMLLGVLACLATGCSFKTDCYGPKIAEVGGCSKYGECKVRLEDGTVRNAYMPIRGEVPCATPYLDFGN